MASVLPYVRVIGRNYLNIHLRRNTNILQVNNNDNNNNDDDDDENNDNGNNNNNHKHQGN